MNRSESHFRDELLKRERVTPSLKERHDQEIREMLEAQLTRPGRMVWGVAAVAGLGFAVVFGTMAVMLPAGTPWQARAGLAGGVPFGIAWAFLGFRILRRGAINLKVDAGIYAGLAWVLPVFLSTMFLVWAPDSIAGLRLILSGLVFLVGGAVFLLQNNIAQAELRSREKLLEIEYRLAELTEAVKAQRPATPGTGGVTFSSTGSRRKLGLGLLLVQERRSACSSSAEWPASSVSDFRRATIRARQGHVRPGRQLAGRERP